MEFFEQYLKSSESYRGNKCFSEDYKLYWEESYRVLKPGGTRFSIDYTISFSAIDASLGIGHYEVAVAKPYSVDLTHFVDFGLQKKLALNAGFSHIVNGDLFEIVSKAMGILFTDGIGRNLLGAIK
ncbi:Uncharacterised protein [uncultured archaeon]|nr:Uncharacterised protein [uncultured archaeon]